MFYNFNLYLEHWNRYYTTLTISKSNERINLSCFRNSERKYELEFIFYIVRGCNNLMTEFKLQ